MDELKRFRQMHSRLRHPKCVSAEWKPQPARWDKALPMQSACAAEKLLAAEFNRPGHEIVNHYTYVFLATAA